MIFDKDEKDQDDLIGRCWITFKIKNKSHNGIKYYYKNPKWYNIVYDGGDQTQGKILLSYALIPE